MPLAHITVPVSSLEASTAFYLRTLAPLGYSTFMTVEDTIVGLNAKFNGPDFWIAKCPEKTSGPGQKLHVAFRGDSQRAVREFYDAALKAGAKDNGAPGERPQYAKGYYAAFVFDLDGNNIECCYYRPLWLTAVQVAPAFIGAVVVGGLAWLVGRAGWL